MIEKKTKNVIRELHTFIYLCNKINKGNYSHNDLLRFFEIYNKYKKIL